MIPLNNINPTQMESLSSKKAIGAFKGKNVLLKDLKDEKTGNSFYKKIDNLFNTLFSKYSTLKIIRNFSKSSNAELLTPASPIKDYLVDRIRTFQDKHSFLGKLYKSSIKTILGKLGVESNPSISNSTSPTPPLKTSSSSSNPPPFTISDEKISEKIKELEATLEHLDIELTAARKEENSNKFRTNPTLSNLGKKYLKLSFLRTDLLRLRDVKKEIKEIENNNPPDPDAKIKLPKLKKELGELEAKIQKVFVE